MCEFFKTHIQRLPHDLRWQKKVLALSVVAFAAVKLCFGVSLNASATDPCSPGAPLTGGTQHCSSK